MKQTVNIPKVQLVVSVKNMLIKHQEDLRNLLLIVKEEVISSMIFKIGNFMTLEIQLRQKEIHLTDQQIKISGLIGPEGI